MKIKIILLLILSVLVSCNRGIERKIKLYNFDKTKCITILTGDKYRYIIAGDYDVIPKNNYVKIDVKQLDLVVDIFYGCWDNDIYEWEFYNYHAKIIENKLDENKYKFSNVFPEDEFVSKEFHCFDFEFKTPKIEDKYKENLIIKLE